MGSAKYRQAVGAGESVSPVKLQTPFLQTRTTHHTTTPAPTKLKKYAPESTSNLCSQIQPPLAAAVSTQQQGQSRIMSAHSVVRVAKNKLLRQ